MNSARLRVQLQFLYLFFPRRISSTQLKRVETRTLRIDTKVGEQLDELAERVKISVNVIAPLALRKHVEYDAYAETCGRVTSSKGRVKTLFRTMWETL